MDEWYAERLIDFTVVNHHLGQGIYHGTMNYSSSSDDFVDSAQLLPYPAADNTSPTPLSMSITEFHFVLLYKDRIAAICNLNDALVYDELLPLVRSGNQGREIVLLMPI